MVICAFTNMNTNACDQKEINVTDLPFLPPIPHYEYQFWFHDMYFTLANMFQ